MERRKPNLLFVFADQMRGMDMGCAGNSEVHTPNIDRLARQGLRFAHAYANTPVCGPSRATLLTGRQPTANGVIANDLPLRSELPSIGKILRDCGYRTGWIGKWHLDAAGRKWTPPGPDRHGFDYWAVWSTAHRYFKQEKYCTDTPEPVVMEGYDPNIQADLAIDFIRSNPDDPFCLFVSWGPPHDPYDQVPDEYKGRYAPEQLTLRPNVRTDSEYLQKHAVHLDPRGTLAHYYAAITALDDQLGRLLSELEQAGIAGDTIVVFTSDHGDMLFSQGTLYKQKPFEESVQIPFLIRYPAELAAGEVREQLFSVCDMAPTLLSLMGCPPLEGAQGRDLSAVLKVASTEGPSAVLLSNPVSAFEGRRYPLPEWRGIRTERYTYTRLQDGTPWHLYDNEKDPYQLRNAADLPELSEIRGELDLLLTRMLEEARDPFLKEHDMIRHFGLVDLWNERERLLHPKDPDLVEEERV